MLYILIAPRERPPNLMSTLTRSKPLTPTQKAILEAAQRGALKWCNADARYVLEGEKTGRYDIVSKLQDDGLLDNQKIMKSGRFALLVS